MTLVFKFCLKKGQLIFAITCVHLSRPSSLYRAGRDFYKKIDHDSTTEEVASTNFWESFRIDFHKPLLFITLPVLFLFTAQLIQLSPAVTYLSSSRCQL